MSQPFINTARGIRKLGIFIPDHIPDRAIIDPKCIELNYRHLEFIGSPCSVPILASVRIDYDKFTWEPYRRPTNARPLVSRAKREGLYCGKHSGNVTCMITGDVFSWSAKHERQGFNQHAVPLRYLKDYVADEVQAVLDKTISKGAS